MLFLLLYKPLSKLAFKFLDTNFANKNDITDKISTWIAGIIVFWPAIIDWIIAYCAFRYIQGLDIPDILKYFLSGRRIA